MPTRTRLSPPNKSPADGLRLGRTAGLPVEISPEALRGGILVLSTDGQVRRRQAVGMVRALARRWPLWVVTNRLHYRCLVDELLVVRRARLKLNVLRPPPGADPLSWRASIWEAFSDIFELPSEDAARGAELLEDVVADVGPEKATLVEVAKRAASRIGDARLHPLVGKLAWAMQHLAPVLNDPYGLDIYRLRGRGVVFEVDGLPLRHQAFLTAALVYGETMGEPRGDLGRLMWFDEGALLWRRRWPEPMRSRWRAALGAMDKAGAGVSLVTEASSTLEPAVLEALGTKMALRSQSPYEEEGVQSLLGADSRRFALLEDDQLLLAQAETSAPPLSVVIEASLLPDLAPTPSDEALDELSGPELRGLGL